MIRRFILCTAAAAILSPLAVSAQESAQGRVYIDRNQNGRFDIGEPGIGGVKVSNQRDVVLSDENGAWSLPLLGDETTLFVIKPAEYDFPVDDFNVAQFYYHHQPKGSPELEFPGIEPTGPLPESIDFALVPGMRQIEFDVVVFSDPQPRNTQEIEFVRDDVVAELAGYNAAFGMTLGDIMFDDLSLFGHYKSVQSQIGLPFYHAPGNHDLNFDAPDDRHSLETYKKHFGPSYYAFEHGMVSFIVLDSVEWTGPKDGERGFYRGYLGEQQLSFIEAYLETVPKDSLIVFATHIPLYFSQSDAQSVNILDREALFEILEGRQHLMAMAGHMHMIDQAELDLSTGNKNSAPFPHITTGAVSGSWWSGPLDERRVPISMQRDGTPNGYHIFQFKGNQFSQTYKGAQLDDSIKARVSFPRGIVKASELAGQKLIANIFNADKNARVEYRLNQGQPAAMQFDPMVDPFVVQYHETFETLIPSWIKPAKNLHMWSADMPADLQPGSHTIEIRVLDQYGETYSQMHVFEVR